MLQPAWVLLLWWCLMAPLLGSWAVDVTATLVLVVLFSFLWWRLQPRICGVVWGRSSRYPGESVVCNRPPGHDGMHLDSTEQVWWD